MVQGQRRQHHFVVNEAIGPAGHTIWIPDPFEGNIFADLVRLLSRVMMRAIG
jgi:hypothetical protein